MKEYLYIKIKPTAIAGGPIYEVGDLWDADGNTVIRSIEYKRDGNMGCRGSAAFVVRTDDDVEIVFNAEDVAFCAVGEAKKEDPEALDIPDGPEEGGQDDDSPDAAG